MTAKLTLERIERIRDGATYTLDEHRTLCEMALRAAAEPEAPMPARSFGGRSPCDVCYGDGWTMDEIPCSACGGRNL